MHFILMLSILAGSHGGYWAPKVVTQEFNTYQACAYAAGLAKSQSVAQASVHGGGTFELNAVCVPKG